MPRGNPDWGVTPYAAAVQSPDPAAAAEYGAYGFNRVDGTGRVILVDNWRNGLSAWRPGLTGLGALPDLSTSEPFVPPVSVRLSVPGAVGTSELRQYLAVGQAENLGVEAAIRQEVIVGAGIETTCQLAYSPTPVLPISIARLRLANSQWEVHHSGGIVALETINTGGEVWFQVKIVGNYQTGEYVRAVIGGNRYDLAGYLMIAGGIGIGGQLLAEVIMNRIAPGAERSYCGYVTVTRDEV